jgi:hypothetical protein
MDQASADMQTETQKPQDQKDDKNRPKHGKLLNEHRAHPFRSLVHLFKTCALANLQLAPRKRLCSREFGLRYFWQLSLTMVKSVTVI